MSDKRLGHYVDPYMEFKDERNNAYLCSERQNLGQLM